MPSTIQLNQMNLADTYGRGVKDRQSEEMNDLTIDATRTEMDDAQRMKNTRWQTGIGKYGMELGDKDPAAMMSFMEEAVKEGQRRGVYEADFDYAQMSPEEIYEGFKNQYEGGMAGMAGQRTHSDVPNEGGPVTQQRNMATNELSVVGASPRGPTSNMQDYAQRNELVQQFGEGSNEVIIFDAYVRANKIVDVDQVPTGVSATTGEQTPLSTVESEAAAAGQIKIAEGEGGRGRVLQPDGTYGAVGGSEAAQKEESAKRERENAAFMKSIQAQTVVKDVERLNTLIKGGGVPFGREAAFQRSLPAVAQSEGFRNANSMIESVKGNVGIDSLLRIKASGAGLGQVPQSQLDMLSRLLGELDMAQSQDQFEYTWNRMSTIYEAIMLDAADNLYELDSAPPNVDPNKKSDIATPIKQAPWSEDQTKAFEDQWKRAQTGDRLMSPDGKWRTKP